jgi:hypothetical protein
MRIQPLITLTAAFLLFIFLSSCQKVTKQDLSQERASVSNSSGNNVKEQSKKIYVTNVGELYTAINDPENSGGTIVLKEGTYPLSAAYPKAGRLELQNNMNLVGQPGHPESVIIDITALPLTSFTLSGSINRTGAIRMGDGNNSIEWMTFQNDPAHTVRSLIQTDIVTTSTSQIRVAHCIIKGSSIGLSILNRDPIANGRLIEADIEDNEIKDNTVPQFGAGIQIQNTTTNNATIKVKLTRNEIHGNKAGVLIFNSSSQGCKLEARSYDDKIENNGIGMVLNGGVILLGTAPTLHNSLRFEGYATTIRNNIGTPVPPFVFPSTGIHTAAAQSLPPFDVPGTSHFNEVEINLNGCLVEGNGGVAQINAYGAHSFYPSSTPAGTNNKTNLYLRGISSNASINSINSFPNEPAGTNTVNVYH